jgi:hypothetical protein
MSDAYSQHKFWRFTQNDDIEGRPPVESLVPISLKRNRVMNSVLVLCVGMLGAASPASVETQNPRPVQVAAANYGILPGGCYKQPAYRSPLAQNVPVGYSAGTANCAGGWCGPIGTRGYTARPYTPVSYSQGTANCPGGVCPTRPAYTARSANCYGPNCPQQVPGSYYPATYETRYNGVPASRFPASGYTQPRFNSYPAARPVDANWPSSYRTLPSSNSQNVNSPFFN